MTEEASMVVNFRLSLSKKPGNLTLLLRTMIEIESEIGISPSGPIFICNSDDPETPACVVLYNRNDARKLLAGRMSENEYFIRHLTPVNKNLT